MSRLLEHLDFESEGVAESQRKAIQNELEITNLLTFSNAPIFSLDNKLVINEWNHSLEIITGYNGKEALGRDLIASFATEDSRKSLTKVFKDTLLGLESTSFQTALLSKAEQRVEILLNTSCRRNSNGDVLGVLCVGQDVTKLRQQEEMLMRSHKLESIGQLTGGIAHDFNNLLTIIQGNIDLLRTRFAGAKDDTEEILSDVHHATVRGASLISQLLTFAGKKTLIFTSIEMNTVIQDSARMIARTLGGSIDIAFQLSDEELFCKIDISLLESALINLSINSRDAMASGKGHLMFSSGKEIIELDRARQLNIDSGEYVTVSLTDNGAGIAPENLSRIIDPFFSTKNLAEASGLGLSMVHGFTRQCKGALDIQSELGRGTTVTLILPSAPAGTIGSKRP
jgi:PAS domain S-box-containing protein